MTIVDVFEHKKKTAVYITVDNDDIPDFISVMIVGDVSYDVIESDVMHSISGVVAITVLIDTKDNIKIGENVVMK